MDGPESPTGPENPNKLNHNLDEYQTFFQKPDEEGMQHLFGVDENGGEHEISYEEVAEAYGHEVRPPDDGGEGMEDASENQGEERSRRRQVQDRFVAWFTDRRSKIGDKVVDTRFKLGDKTADWVSEGRLSRTNYITKQLHENYLHGEKSPGKTSTPELLASYAIEQMLHETQAEPAKRSFRDLRHGVQPVGEPDQVEMSAERRMANRLAPAGHRLKNRLESVRTDALKGVLRELGVENIDMERWGNQVNPMVVRDFRRYWMESRQAEGLTAEAAGHHITTGGLASVYRTPQDFEDYFDVDFEDFQKRGNDVIPENVYRFVNTLLRLPDHQLDALAEVAGPAADNPYEWINDDKERNERFKEVIQQGEANRLRAVEQQRRRRLPHTTQGEVIELDDIEAAEEDEEKDSWDLALGYIAGQQRHGKSRGEPFSSMSIESLTKFFERNGLSEEDARRTYVDLQDEGIIDTQHTPGYGFRVNRAILEDHLSHEDESTDKGRGQSEKEKTEDQPEKKGLEQQRVRQEREEREAQEKEEKGFEQEREIEEEERRQNPPEEE